MALNEAQEQARSGMLELMDMLAERLKKSETRQKLKAAMLAAGFTVDDFRTFNTLRSHLDAFIEVGGCVSAIACSTDHLPSARYAIATVDYLTKAALFMYGVLDKAQISPKEFGLTADPAEFYAAINEKKVEAQAVIDKHALAASLQRKPDLA